jgi:hypothetical protein
MTSVRVADLERDQGLVRHEDRVVRCALPVQPLDHLGAWGDTSW